LMLASANAKPSRRDDVEGHHSDALIGHAELPVRGCKAS